MVKLKLNARKRINKTIYSNFEHKSIFFFIAIKYTEWILRYGWKSKLSREHTLWEYLANREWSEWDYLSLTFPCASFIGSEKFEITLFITLPARFFESYENGYCHRVVSAVIHKSK